MIDETPNDSTPSDEPPERSARTFSERARESYRLFFEVLPSRTVIVLRWLVALTILVVVFEFIERVFSESDKKVLENREIVTRVRTAAKGAAERVSTLRDGVARDIALRSHLAHSQQALVFTRLIGLKEEFDDSLATFIQKEEAPSAAEQYSVGIYGPDRRLVAWSNTSPLRSPWDSVLTDLKYIENKSRAIYVERRSEYVWLIALRKISDTSSQGYIVSRALLAYAPGEKHSNPQSFNFIDPVSRETEHSLDIDYTPRTPPPMSANEPYAIIAEQGEPATFIGLLRIGDPMAHKEAGILRIAVAARELLTGILLYFLFGSIIYVLMKRRDLSTDPKIRLQVCEVVLALFIIARVAIMLLGNFSTLLPERVRNTDVFGIADLPGIAGNPLELFLTAVSFATCIAVIARIVTSSSGPRQVTIPFWKFTLYFLVFIALQIALIHVFKLALSGIIVNSTITPYPIEQAIPEASELCVYFAIVSLGFAYCVMAASTLVWLLTAWIPIMRLDNYELLVGRGVVLVIVVLLFTAAALSLAPPSPGLLLTDNYWLIVALSVLAITAIVWLAQLKSDTSKLISRFSIISGLSILVLVSGGSLVVAPLVASLEFDNKISILEVSSGRNEERALEHAAKLEAAFMQPPGDADTTRANTAYEFWKENLRDEEIGSLAVVTDGKNIYSEYGQSHLQIATKELVAFGDSVARQLKKLRLPYAVRVVAPDSFAMASVDNSSVVGVRRLDSTKGLPNAFLVVLVAPIAEGEGQPHFLTSLTGGHGNGHTVRAVFVDNTLREASDPSLNIPSHLPHDTYMHALSSETPIRSKLLIDQDEYLFVVHPSAGRVNKVITTGIRVPGIPEVFEIALYIHFIGILLAIIFAISNFIIRAFFTSQQQVFIRFRERILLIVIVLAFIPLVLVTNVTRSLLAERESSRQGEQLAIDANAAVNRLRDNYMDSATKHNARTVLRESAATLHRSIQLYDMHGLLQMASDDKLVQAGFISPALDLEAVKEILVNGKTFALQNERVGSTTIVRSAFQALPSPASARPLGILAIRDIGSATSQEADIAATISFIYGVFAAIAVLLLLIGALFAYLVSRPISKVIQATEQVAGGAYGVVVPIDRKDEMGDLANAFNRMSLELDKSRERLAQSEREVAWKEMARQVAHEIKNPLTPMKLSVQHVEHAYETKDVNFETIFKRVVRTLSEQINVLTRIASEFARFGEMPRRKYTFVTLRKVIESAIALFDADRGRIRFVVEVPENMSSIYADEEEFRRTLVNLIRNAIQAIDKWGVVIISASERHGIVHLKITDTGSGIPKETLAKIFVPNFSTKTSGMGLGLAIVKRSITDMSGQISVESEVGKGTTFHIELPAREAPHL